MRTQFPVARLVPVIVLGLVAALLWSRFRLRDAAAQPPDAVALQTAAENPAIDRKRLRYDGKDFAYWRDYVLTELKPERRLDALTALSEFAVNGYENEVASAVAGLLRQNRMLELSRHSDADGKFVQQTESVLRQIGEAGLAVAIDALKDPRNRWFAVDVLTPSRSDGGIVLSIRNQQALVDDVLGEDMAVRWGAALVLAHQETWDRETLLRDEPSRRRFGRALASLVNCHLPEDLDGDRTSVIAFIGKQGSDAADAVPALLERLTASAKVMDEYDGHAPATADALGSIGRKPKQVIPVLVTLLDHPASSVRAAGARNLGRFGRQARVAEPKLSALVKDRKPVFPNSSWGSATATRAATLQPAGPDTARTEDPDVYFEMLNAITLVTDRPETTVASLVELLDSGEPKLRIRVCKALARIGPSAREAVPRLEKCTGSTDQELKTAAQEAIRSIRKE